LLKFDPTSWREQRLFLVKHAREVRDEWVEPYAPWQSVPPVNKHMIGVKPELTAKL
jgi:hypothetical protein